MDQDKLLQLGLNKNEAKVYITLLRSGQSSAGELIKKTEFHRNIVYDNLEKLIDKGLVTFIIEGKRKVFQAASPEMITEFVEKEQVKLDVKKQVANEIKKEVIKIQSTIEDKQEATIFRGIDGIKAVLQDTLKTDKDYLAFGAPKLSLDIIGSTYWENYTQKRVEKNMKVKMIFSESLRKWSKIIENKHTILRFLPKTIDSFSETIIYGNKVVIIVWSEKPIATLIRDKNLAESYKQYFSLLWKQAKP